MTPIIRWSFATQASGPLPSAGAVATVPASHDSALLLIGGVLHLLHNPVLPFARGDSSDWPLGTGEIGFERASS
jgi:hypothetical protein